MNNDLKTKMMEFSIDIINLCDKVSGRAVLTNQLLRSATSIGANVREGKYAHTTADFISKFEIALKECYETEYWLELLFATNTINEATFKDLQQKAGLIRRLLIASCKTAKGVQ